MDATYFLDNKTERRPEYFNGPAVSLHIRIEGGELYTLWIAEPESPGDMADIFITDTPTGSVIYGQINLGVRRAHLRLVSHGEDFFRSLRNCPYNPTKLIQLFEKDNRFAAKIALARHTLFLNSDYYKQVC